MAVKTRSRPHQRQRLPDRPTVGFDIVRSPQHQCDTARQRGVGPQQLVRLPCAIFHGKGGGHAEWIKGVNVAACRQDFGRADHIATGHGCDKLSVQRAHQR